MPSWSSCGAASAASWPVREQYNQGWSVLLDHVQLLISFLHTKTWPILKFALNYFFTIILVERGIEPQNQSSVFNKAAVRNLLSEKSFPKLPAFIVGRLIILENPASTLRSKQFQSVFHDFSNPGSNLFECFPPSISPLLFCCYSAENFPVKNT